jgi:hypothetical protein
MEKIYSNKLNKGIIDFIDEKFGSAVTDEIFKRINLDRLALTDPNGFVSDEVTHALTTTAMELTGEKRITYLAGRNMPKTLGKLGGFMVGITSPTFFMKSLGEIEPRLALKTINSTRQVGRGRYRIEITYKDGFMAKPYTCDNRIGCYESVPLFFGLPYAKVEHPQCAHRKEGNCVYYVQFPEFSFLAFKRIALLLFVACFALVPVGILAGPAKAFLAVSVALLVAGLSCLSLYKHLSAKKALEWALIGNEVLVEQNRMLETMNHKLALLAEMNGTLSEIGTIEEASRHVVEGLVKRFGFGSSQIWLLDEDSEFLGCAAAHGYTPEILEGIKQTRFRLGENWDNPHGLLVQTMKEGKTVVANDMGEVLPRLSESARSFLEFLKISSLIMTPLSHGGRTLGILAGEYHRGEKVVSQDRLIFQSIAHVLGSVLIKASYPLPKALP